MPRRRVSSRQLPLPLAPGAIDPRCVYRLQQGKFHSVYSPGPYSFCISKQQHDRLFGGYIAGVPVWPRPLETPSGPACGIFGCVYPYKNDPSKVVKITRDGSDTAGLRRMNGSPYTPRVFESHELKTRPRWFDDYPLYDTIDALVLERARPLNKKKWSDAFECVLVAGKLGESCCTKKYVQGFTAAEKRDCRKLVRQWPEIGRAFRASGVQLNDTHTGNIAMGSDGNWKIIDLGFSSVRGGSRPKALSGARRRRQRG
jgi:hypothetical protein